MVRLTERQQHARNLRRVSAFLEQQFDAMVPLAPAYREAATDVYAAAQYLVALDAALKGQHGRVKRALKTIAQLQVDAEQFVRLIGEAPARSKGRKR